MDFSSRGERFAARFPENEELLSWLRKEQPEPVLEPDLPILDPHHHLWDKRRSLRFPYRQKVYTLNEILEDMYDGHNVVGTVYVEAGAFYRRQGPAEFRPVGEVEYCQGVAAACDSGIYGPSRDHFTRVCMGIQGTCDLHHPIVEAVLKQMMANRNFRGVRAGGPYDEAFKRGFRLLEKYGLVFDRWHHPDPIYNPDELPRLKELAKEFPGVTIVLDHLGGAVGPKMGGPEAEACWRADISDLAASCPNVVCKVGGIQMVVNGFGLEKRSTPIGSEELAELTYPWYSHVLDAFGADRCMFESNFPVDKDSVTYRTLWNTFKRVAAKKGLSDAEKRSVFHDTAVRVYKLTPPGPQAAL
uniref:Amidohydrolase-related domain-containing protein n=1 Tax=Alexandrium monilatum TaxID=311494 RepID=A0A7S4SMC5_9DINO|mmetsp:Transcript_56674/g.168677  ORF Transcript_56674/g.168677 Transcript_56674/m.168677 type:complete len:357 (-) Transcript_56674:200-1270(-)